MSNVLQKYKTLLRVSFVASVIYLLWRTFFTLPLENGTLAMALGVSLLLAEVMGVLEYWSVSYFMSDVRVPERRNPPDEWYPDIDVFIATYNEPIDILQKTISACLMMDYVAGRKVNIYICDDGRRDAVGALCEQMGVRHLTRPDNKDAKAGNYNNALRETRQTGSPLIVNFDADMLPRRNFLMAMVPYFYISPEEAENRKAHGLPPQKIGFVQAPQRFYNPDLFQFNLYSEKDVPNEQDFFFQEIQLGRNKCNAAICCGSNVIFSREALENTGGYVTGVITEDFATAIRIQEHGYTTYAVPDNVAHGLSPMDWKNLIRQRRRWARGCIQTLYKFRFFRGGNLNLWQKMAYFSAGLYWCFPVRRTAYLLSPIIFSLFGIPILDCSMAEILVIALPTYLLQFSVVRKLSNGIRNYSLSSLYENILFPFLLPSIVMEILGIKARKFHVTAKKKEGEIRPVLGTFLDAFPHIALTLLNMLSIAVCIRAMFSTGLPFYMFIIFWLLLNLHTTYMSASFMLGRKIQREHERFEVPVLCEIAWGQHAIKTNIDDISESGFAVTLEHPFYIPEGTILDVTLDAGGQRVQAKADIANVASMEKGYRYAFRFLDDRPEWKNTLSRIIYDGEPILPSKLSTDHSVLADLVRNIKFRLSRSGNLKSRRQPRIALDVPGVDFEIVNFNYKYVLLNFPEGQALREVSIPIDNVCSMKCVLHNIRPNGDAIYQVENLDEIHHFPAFSECIRRWAIPGSQERTLLETMPRKDDYFDEKVYLS